MGKKNPSLVITLCHHSASLVMPNGDPRNGFFSPALTNNYISQHQVQTQTIPYILGSTINNEQTYYYVRSDSGHRRDLKWTILHSRFCCHADQDFFSEGVQLFFLFLVNEWIQIPLKSGHHRPASETPFKWRFAGVQMMAQH